MRLLLATTFAALTLSAVRPVAHAQVVAGAIQGGPIVSDGDVGGGLSVDLWAAIDWFRIGGFAGALTIPSARDSHNRFATPIGMSVAAVANLGDVDLEIRLRGGLWGGSTQEVKMTAGGFLGGGAFLDVHLGGGASLGGGLEVWGFLGAGATWAISPMLTLTFGPPPAEPSAPAAPEVL
jgi:hypothetical protein